MTNLKHALGCGIALAVAISTGPVVAQERVLDEITVTAQKREQSISDIGVTVSAFSDEQLEALGVETTADVMKFTPGATLTYAGQGIPIYTIRGIGFDDYNSNSSSTVGINFDEVAIPYPIMSRVPQYDVERLEVLKGPQGTLYGQNTTGGSINFITKKPDLEGNSASVKASFDSDSKFGVQGNLNSALSNNFAIRASFFTEDGGAWQKNAAIGAEGEEHGDADTKAIRLQALWDASDKFSLLFKADWHQDKSDNIVPKFREIFFINPDIDLVLDPGVTQYVTDRINASGLPDPADPNAAAWNPGGNAFGGQNPDGKFDRNNDGLLLSLRAEWDLGPVMLTSLTAFNDYERDEANAWDGTGLKNWDSYNNTKVDFWSQELRLTSQTDGKVSWIAGLYFSGDDVTEVSTGSADVNTANIYVTPATFDFLLGGGGAGDLNGDGVIDQLDMQLVGFNFDLFSTQYLQETTSAAAFVHTEWVLSDTVNLTLGARFTDDERKMIDSCTYDIDGTLALFFQELVFEGAVPYSQGDCVSLNPATFESAPYNETVKTDNTSYKVGLDWRPTEDVLLYGNISTGYKTGGFGAPAAASWDSLASYDAEEVTSYELGIKSSLAEGTVQLNAAIYTYDYEDKQVSAFIIDPVFGSLTKIVNAPEATVSGAEMELNWNIGESTLARFTTSFLDSKYDRFASYLFGQSTAANPNPVDLSGTRIQNTPEWQHNLMVHHEFDIGTDKFGFVGGDWAYSDDYISLVGNNPAFKVDAYNVVQLRGGFGTMDDRWRVTGWVKNLFDEDYYTAVSPSNDANVLIMGRERTYGVSFQYNWN